MGDELDDYLAQHTALPSLGAGRFTLDPSRQQKMLAGLGLCEPELGLLKLAQAAVRSAAPQLQFSTGKDRLCIQFSPAQPPANPLWSLEGVEPWQRDLALGLLTLSQRYRVLWHTGTHRGQAQNGAFEECQDPQPSKGLQLTLERPRRWWERPWLPRFKRLFDHRLNFIPLETTWDEQPSRRMERLSAQAEALVYAPEGQLWFPKQSFALEVHRRGEAGPLQLGYQSQGLAWMAPGSRSWSQACFVVHGVHLGFESNVLDRPGITGIFCVSGLVTDLSGLHLVHGAEFRRFLESLRPEIRWLDEIIQRGVH